MFYVFEPTQQKSTIPKNTIVLGKDDDRQNFGISQ